MSLANINFELNISSNKTSTITITYS